MLLVFMVLYTLQYFPDTLAGPLSANLPRQTTMASSLAEECICQNNRSVWDIVWSCLATIFACSWVSVHPNISEKGERWQKKALRRLELTFWSIMSPEIIIFWAMRQWLGARHLRDRYRRYRWTMTHGHFIQMGGFMLYRGEKAEGILSPECLREELLRENMINMPSVTEEDIQALSKGDGLSKALVIIQTTWFIIQCIARKVEGVAITELELLTVAFSTLNGVMNFFWWDKPLNAESRVPVYILGNRFLASETEGHTDTGNPQAGNIPKTAEDAGTSKLDPENLNTIAQTQPTKHLGAMRDDNRLKDLALQAWWIISDVFFRWPTAGIHAIVHRMNEVDSVASVSRRKMRVKTFYAYNTGVPQEFPYLVSVLMLIGVGFGAIHCAGWNFIFPSQVESSLWRIFSTMIAGIPAAGFGLVTIMLNIPRLLKIPGIRITEESVVSPVRYTVGVCAACYILARLVLLVEAVVLLRDLQPEELAAVEWTTFIPHI